MDKTTILQQFKNNGFEIYEVGGSIRNLLLDEPINDYDFCTNALPDQTFALLSKFGNPYRVGEKYGTISIGDIEVTTYRKEVYRENNRKPIVEFGASLADDLARRDFTINAIVFDGNKYIDLFGGQQDIEKRLIRAVGNPYDRFQEDPLRLLRAIRFASSLSFDIADQTWDALCELAHSISFISQERITEEYNKILLSKNPQWGLNLLLKSGLLAQTAPELLVLTDPRPQGKYHIYSIWDHTLSVVASVPPVLHLRLAALLHDSGKCEARTEDESGIHFVGHEEYSEKIARRFLSHFLYSNRVQNDVCLLVSSHMMVNNYGQQWRNGTIRRLQLRLGDRLNDAIELAKSDSDSHKNPNPDRFVELSQRIAVLNEEPVNLCPLSGDELMQRYNLQPGPWIKRMKDSLTNAVLDGKFDSSNKDAAFAYCDTIRNEGL